MVKFFFKNILRVIFLILFLFFFTGLYQAVEYDNKYVNRYFFQIDFNKIRTPTIKKVFLKTENWLNKFFFINNKIDNFTENLDLPKYKYVKSKLLNIKTTNQKKLDIKEEEWIRSNKNSSSQRFSKLNYINENNVKDLKVAWIYNSNDGVGQIQSNPIIVKDMIITPTPGHYIVALDSKNGQEIWRFKPKSNYPAQRGLIYWKGNQDSKPGIFFSDHSGLYKLNIKNGKLDKSFGKNGYIKTSLSKTSPVIIGNDLIISTFAPSIDIIDVNNGNIKWKYFLRDKQKKIYINSYFKLGGCNPWGGISADENRKIVYVTTGNAQPDYFGLRRPGNNKFCNSILAIDLQSRKKLFDFQEISHDVWNKDMASPPILGSVKTKKGNVDVVIAMSKTGNIILLDRLNGLPIFDLRYRLSEDETIKNKYFLDLEKPEPVENFEFLSSDIINITDELKKEANGKLKNKKFGFYIKPSHDYELLTWTGYGGVPWTGGSFDDENDILYVNSNRIPGVLKLDNKNDQKYSLKEFLLDNGYPGTKPPWGSLNALDLKTGKIKWKVPLGEYSNLTELNFPVTGTENYGGALATRGGLVFASGSLDKKIRAYSSKNGEILWEYLLPNNSFVAPTTYMRDNEQFLIVVATGGGVLKKKYPNLVSSGDTFIAFKIDKNE